MTAEVFEVALLKWSPESGGVRLLGRTVDADLVRHVQRHLIQGLSTGEADGNGARLYLVKPNEPDGDPDNPRQGEDGS